MRRLFWIGVGAAGAVLAADRLRRTARRYTPAGVTEQVEEVGRRTTSALHDAADRFRSARHERERDLVAQLLVTPEGGDAGAVLGRRRGRHAEDATATADGRPTGRVDEDEPLYEF